jgi:hypothetical protein
MMGREAAPILVVEDHVWDVESSQRHWDFVEVGEVRLSLSMMLFTSPIIAVLSRFFASS